MEARRSDSDQVKKALQEGVSRIESMALVHEVISHYEEDYIELRTIAEELIRLLKRSFFRSEDNVQCEYIGDSILLSSQRAGYVSLILNELISNSFEHGFGCLKTEETISSGSMVVAGYLTKGLITLTVTDNGCGLPDDFDVKASRRLGLQIIQNLVTNELGGTMTIEDRAHRDEMQADAARKSAPHQGTIVTITFPE